MPIPDIKLMFTPPNRLYQEALSFFRFFRVAARKHKVNVIITASKDGVFTLLMPGADSLGLDAFLQEITLQRGLYYYLCGVPNRRDVARRVVKPVFEDLLRSQYAVSYPVQIRKQLLEGALDWAGGSFLERTAQQYEILQQKLKIKLLTPYEFIRDLDDMLTEFMLIRLEHPKGEQSPKFNSLVDKCGQQNVLRSKEVRKLFNRVHGLRTRGLHRLEREIPDAEIAEISHEIYFVFAWFDDYWRAQNEKTTILSGKRYRRIKYGKEPVPKGAPPDYASRWADITAYPCHDCDVICGELHLDGCDMERCPRCNGQYMCCHCRVEQDELES